MPVAGGKKKAGAEKAAKVEKAAPKVDAAPKVYGFLIYSPFLIPFLYEFSQGDSK